MTHPINKYLLLILSFILLLSSCSTVRQIRPLDRGQSAMGLSVGGPITEVGKIYIPLPLLCLSYNRGILDKKLDLETGLQITQILYGILHLDIGVNYRPWQSRKWRPGFIVSPKIFLITDFEKLSTFRAYPDLGLTFFWEVKSNWYLYTGIENWFEFHQTRDDGNKQEHHWLIAPYLGINMGNEKWLFQFETRVYTPNLANTGRPTKNIGFGEYGILGFFLGVNYTFESKK